MDDVEVIRELREKVRQLEAAIVALSTINTAQQNLIVAQKAERDELQTKLTKLTVYAQQLEAGMQPSAAEPERAYFAELFASGSQVER